MRRDCLPALGTVLASLLLAAALYGSEARIAVPEFTAVRMTKPPVIDGRVAPDEWAGTLTTSGVIAAFDHQLLNSDTAMSVGWDPEHLYFLFRCRRGPGEWRLTKGVRFNDDYDFGDPSVEIWVAPPKAVPETYQNIINTYPAVLDALQIPSRGYTGVGWRGNWKLGVSEDADGYVLEAAVPVADFGMPPLKDGDQWRLLLCRTCQGSQPRSQGSWSATQAFSEIPQYPPVRFRDDGVAVGVEGVHTLLAGTYRIPLTLTAPRGADARVTVALRWHEGPLPGVGSDIVQVQDVTLAAGGRTGAGSARLGPGPVHGRGLGTADGGRQAAVGQSPASQGRADPDGPAARRRHDLPPVVPVHRNRLDLVAPAEAGRRGRGQAAGHLGQVRSREPRPDAPRRHPGPAGARPGRRRQGPRIGSGARRQGAGVGRPAGIPRVLQRSVPAAGRRRRAAVGSPPGRRRGGPRPRRPRRQPGRGDQAARARIARGAAAADRGGRGDGQRCRREERSPRSGKS